EPPAFHATRGGQRTRVGGPGSDRRNSIRQAAHAYGSQSLSRGTVAELTVGVKPPAFHSASAGQRASVRGSGRDLRDAAREARCVDRNVALRLRPVPDLTIAIETPALDTATRGERARVELPGADRRGSARQAV